MNYVMSCAIYIETLTNSFPPVILDIFGLSAYISGVLVVISRNPVKSVLWLIGLFLFISAYLFIIGLQYVGLAYLLVYVGAVSILFLFIVMLINVRLSELLDDTSNSWPLAIIISVLFITFVGILNPNSIVVVPLALGISWDRNLWESNHITSIGNIMYTHVSILLIITSIILLLAMVGSIVITKKPENNGILSKIYSILDETQLIILSCLIQNEGLRDRAHAAHN